MAYFDGGTDSEQMPIVDRMDKEYKIYVKNLPQELNEDGIKDIFGQFGQVTGIFHPRNATWCYISYGSYREAELAIRNLNDVSPLDLQVTLAKETFARKEEQLPETSQKKPVVADSVAEPIFTNRDLPTKPQQSIGRGHAICKGFTMQRTMLMHKSIENGSSQSVSPPTSQISNAYENEGPFISTNRLWTRGTITVTPDGRRHVSLGRGYTMYEFPEMNPNIEDYITKVHELRNNDLYEHAEDKFRTGLQKCCVCSVKTTKHCEKCLTYYCSKSCQINDWPRHQTDCERIPALIEEIDHNVSLLEINKDGNKSKPSVFNEVVSNNIQLRRPYVPIQMENSKSTNIHNSVNKDNADAAYNSTKDKYIDNQDQSPFVSCGDNINLSQSKKPDKFSMNTVNTKSFSQQNRLHRYNTDENTDQVKRKDEHSSSASDFTHQNRIRNQNGAISKNASAFNGAISKNPSGFKTVINNDNSSVRSKYNYTDRTQYNQKNGSQNDKSSMSYNNKEIANKQGNRTSISNMASDGVFYKDTYLLNTKFIDVKIIIPLGNKEYWIYKAEESSARLEIMSKLQVVAENASNVQPIIGNIYGVLFDTIWNRAMIIALNPVKVHFIDFGNNEVLERSADIKDIGHLTIAPRFARKIRLTQAASEKYNNLSENDQISVKMLSVDADETIVVEVQEQVDSSVQYTTRNVSSSSDANNSTKFVLQQKLTSSNTDAPSTDAPSTDTSKIQLPDILDALSDLLIEKAVPKLKIIGVIQIFESIEKNIYNATLCPQDFISNMEKIVDVLPVECAKMKKYAGYKPQVGDLICGKTENGEWYRGYISSTSPDLHIAAIDNAKILPIHEAFPYPKMFLNICTFGVICKTTTELKTGTTYDFTATMNQNDYDSGILQLEINKNNEIITATIKSWKHIRIPAFPTLRNRTKVCLTSYRNQCVMFARSLDEEEIEYYNNIMQSVAQCARTAPRLSESSNINNKMVIAPFSDGNNYRAMITKNQDDQAMVVYVDFGNFGNINIKELRVLPDDLGTQRSCSARITLKDVPRDVPMTVEVNDYLSDLVGKEIPLTCVYEDGLLKEGVHLTTPTGESVNNMINKLLKPGWKRENYDDKTCYMGDDIKIANLGCAGDTVNALILHVHKDMTCMMGPCDMDLITHISEVMPALIKEYCEKTEYYIPRANELCLALYEGGWYRALCLDPTQSQTTCHIFFVDYGNVEFVEHKNVRIMPKDFITPAAMANRCTVVNLAPVDNMGNYSSDIKQKIMELVCPNTLVKIKIIERVDEDEYKIELPDIRATLIEQNLVPKKI